MRDPHVGAKILQFVVLDVLLGVPDDLEDKLVAAVRQHEGALVTERRIEGVVQAIGIAPNKLIFQLARRQRLQPGGLRKRLEHRRLDPNDIAVHVGRPHFEAGDVAVIANVILPRGQRHVEVGQHKLPLHLGVHRRVEQRHLQEVVRIQDLARHADLLRHQAGGCNATALAVATVLHLDRRLIDELAAHGNGAGKAGDATATLLGALTRHRLAVAIDLAARGQKTIGMVAHSASSARA